MTPTTGATNLTMRAGGGLRVALVAYPWRSTIGGISRYVFSLATQLVERGVTVQILANDAEADRHGDVTVGGENWRLACSTYLALRRLNPDVVHCHDNPWMALGSLVFARRYGRRFVFTLHTRLTRRANGPTDGLFDKLQALTYDAIRVRFYRCVLRRADAATAVSRALADDVGVADITVVPFGVDSRIPAPEEVQNFRSAFRLGPGPILASIGVFYHEWKIAGFELLMSAFAAIGRRHPSAVLVIAGDGDPAYRQRLHRRARELGIADQTVFTGFLTDVTSLLAICDVYAHLALNEALGFAIAEAMAVGKPVVGANLAGIPELIESGKTGLLVQANVNDVVEALEWVLANPDRARDMGRAAQERIRKQYTWTVCTDAFLELYEPSG